ncbi:uncharacterized protein TEOVI_000494600 [Trypanosoma equiperdum]|uniref:J domain-containing protein n=2 Tax=Trypanozoon TaxID=39700 RepID=Q385T3_TRYB2|nr:hypothetical protein, conserved [Trypanosoma brucei brucei TREU927]EAN79448.1 hypothetical protein, conserved [Trypanosoma brucei brucei TREU927]SCU66426.1 hypothetical protein, conserved [Trypanosoma equiperdum]
MLRPRSVLLCSSLQRVAGAIELSKDYQSIEARSCESAEAEEKRKEYERFPLRYQLLECKPGVPLALMKLKYLLACRRTHPDAGGDAEDFLRVCLAYQDVMKDYGVETIENKIVNLGNFQVDRHEARNYLEGRAQIKGFIPVSTLEDYISKLEEVKARIGDDLAERLATNDDEALLLLEDIEEIMEANGLRTVRLEVLESGDVRVLEKPTLTDGTERPLLIGDLDNLNRGTLEVDRPFGPPSGVSEDGGVHFVRENESHDEQGLDAAEGQRALRTAEITAEDIEVLTAKHTVQDRTDVAGLASRTATEVMNNTEEVYKIRLESSVLYVFVISVFVLLYVYVEGLMRAKVQEKKRPQVMSHVTTDTMLPWWGNDAEYESQVKRIFVEEWRRARASSRRVQTFQDGVSRESLDENTKKELDLGIFTVTAERLREMRERAEKHTGLR